MLNDKQNASIFEGVVIVKIRTPEMQEGDVYLVNVSGQARYAYVSLDFDKLASELPAYRHDSIAKPVVNIVDGALFAANTNVSRGIVLGSVHDADVMGDDVSEWISSDEVGFEFAGVYVGASASVSLRFRNNSEIGASFNVTKTDVITISPESGWIDAHSYSDVMVLLAPNIGGVTGISRFTVNIPAAAPIKLAVKWRTCEPYITLDSSAISFGEVAVGAKV